jgi:hypothetical protein
MGGPNAPDVPNATGDLRKTLRFMRQGGADKAFKLSNQWNPKFQDLGWDRIDTSTPRLNDISQSMWDQMPGLNADETSALRAQYMGGLAERGLVDSDFGLAQMAAGIGQADLSKRQQNFGHAMTTLGLSPGAAFGPPDVQQLFDAQRGYSQARTAAEWQQRQQNSQRNSMYGAGGGALAGAIGGSMIFPGVGTLIGAGIGAGVGGAIGGSQY